MILRESTYIAVANFFPKKNGLLASCVFLPPPYPPSKNMPILTELFVLGAASMIALMKAVFPIVLLSTLFYFQAQPELGFDTVHTILTVCFLFVTVGTSINTIVLIYYRFQQNFLDDSGPFHRFQILNTFAVHLEVLLVVTFVNMPPGKGPPYVESTFIALLLIDLIMCILYLVLEFQLYVLQRREVTSSQEHLLRP